MRSLPVGHLGARAASALAALFVLGAGSALGGLLAGCPSYAVIPDADRALVDETHTGSLLFLRQSMYVGQFYDDDRYRLIHPRRFEELTYLETLEGTAIPPPPADGIIPAGTRVRVERIEWPVGEVVFRRPLYTPRYTTWIVLRVARDRGPEVTVERDQRHILLLPGGIGDAETFDVWFDASLTAEDPNPWILSLPVEQQNGIALKRPVVGMSYDALTTAVGFPDTLTRELQGGATVEVGVWGAMTVTLRDGVVEHIRDPAAARAEVASAGAAVSPPRD
jgi:hypothetical protein